MVNLKGFYLLSSQNHLCKWSFKSGNHHNFDTNNNKIVSNYSESENIQLAGVGLQETWLYSYPHFLLFR